MPVTTFLLSQRVSNGQCPNFRENTITSFAQVLGGGSRSRASIVSGRNGIQPIDSLERDIQLLLIGTRLESPSATRKIQAWRNHRLHIRENSLIALCCQGQGRQQISACSWHVQHILDFQFALNSHIINAVNQTITNTHSLHGNVLLRYSGIDIHRPVVAL
jgi:hypothetical protein